jgi:hypothetical protein
VHHLAAADGQHFFRLSIFAERFENVSAVDGLSRLGHAVAALQDRGAGPRARERYGFAALRRQKQHFHSFICIPSENQWFR